mgnify:CR=1 FL=1
MKLNKKVISICLGFLSLPVHADLNTDQVCRAGIATIMSKSPSIVTVDERKGDVRYLSYIRQSDGSKWGYKCQVKGFRIHWGSIRNDGSEGRWRTHPADDQVVFETGIDTITVTEGGYNSKTFKNTEL